MSTTTTTTENTKVTSFQNRKDGYTLVAVSGESKFVHHFRHEDFDDKVTPAKVAAELKRLEAEADEAHRSYTAWLRRQRGRLGNSTLEEHDNGITSEEAAGRLQQLHPPAG